MTWIRSSEQRNFTCRACGKGGCVFVGSHSRRSKEDLCSKCFAAMFPNDTEKIPRVERPPRFFADSPHPLDVKRGNAKRRRNRGIDRDMRDAERERQAEE